MVWISFWKAVLKKLSKVSFNCRLILEKIKWELHSPKTGLLEGLFGQGQEVPGELIL
jgi:hypothetical protein